MVAARRPDILDHLAAGLTNAEIGQRLHLSGKTVANNVSAILAKLQLTQRSQAIVRARDAGLAGPADWPRFVLSQHSARPWRRALRTGQGERRSCGDRAAVTAEQQTLPMQIVDDPADGVGIVGEQVAQHHTAGLCRPR